MFSGRYFDRLIVSIGIGVGVTAVTMSLGFWYYRRLKRNAGGCKAWRRVGTLHDLYFFPVKSCAPIEFGADSEVPCELLGLQWHGINDRSLMLIDSNNEMVTGRGYPKMVVIKTEIIGPAQLRISAPGREPLEVNFAKFSHPRDQTTLRSVVTSVWGAEVKLLYCGETYDTWFSQTILGKENGLHLVYYHHAKPVRTVDRNMKHEPNISYKDTGTLGDATSYMLMNLSSVDDLNTRLSNPVSPLQFRGNFYVELDDQRPYAEDKWDWVKIGEDAIFRVVAPCTRCIMPNINANTGERDPDFEPLKTLKTYRKVKNYRSPPLGVHLGLRQRGNVKLHDVVYVRDE